MLSSINENFHLAFKKPCPKHLEGNLKEQGFRHDLINLYWKATNAKTKFQYDKIIEMMKEVPNGMNIFLDILIFYIGKTMEAYLSKITNWSNYVAFERGIILYEMKSDNVIEIVFSWLKESRCYITPYFVTYSILSENVKRIETLRKSLQTEMIEGVTPR